MGGRAGREERSRYSGVASERGWIRSATGEEGSARLSHSAQNLNRAVLSRTRRHNVVLTYKTKGKTLFRASGRAAESHAGCMWLLLVPLSRPPSRSPKLRYSDFRPSRTPCMSAMDVTTVEQHDCLPIPSAIRPTRPAPSASRFALPANSCLPVRPIFKPGPAGASHARTSERRWPLKQTADGKTEPSDEPSL